jgi:hypothetical protein
MAGFLVGIALGALMMRPKNESKNVQEDLIDFVFNISQTFISNNSQTLAATGYTSQELKLDHITYIDCGHVTARNFVNSTTTLSGKLDVNQQIELSSNLQAYMSSNIAAIANQTTGWMTLFSGGNKATNIQRIVDQVNASVSQTMIQDTLNQVYGDIYVNQKVDLSYSTFDCTGMDNAIVDIGNTAIVTLVADAVSKVVSRETQDDSIEMKALASMKAEIQQSAGTGGSWLKWVAIIIAIGLVLGFILYISMMTKKSGSRTKRA